MITREEFRSIAGNGIWKQNTSIAQILGLCPLLAVTTNAVNGIMLSLATIIVMALANVAVASLRNFIPHEIRIPVFILIVAALVTVVDLLFNANLHELYLVLGIFKAHTGHAAGAAADLPIQTRLVWQANSTAELDFPFVVATRFVGHVATL